MLHAYLRSIAGCVCRGEEMGGEEMGGEEMGGGGDGGGEEMGGEEMGGEMGVLGMGGTILVPFSCFRCLPNKNSP